jgi:hypothetical protein
MGKTFKVVKTVWIDEKPNTDEKNKPIKNRTKVKTLEVIATGLEWDAAKEIRKASKGEIIPE